MMNYLPVRVPFVEVFFFFFKLSFEEEMISAELYWAFRPVYNRRDYGRSWVSNSLLTDALQALALHCVPFSLPHIVTLVCQTVPRA